MVGQSKDVTLDDLKSGREKSGFVSAYVVKVGETRETKVGPITDVILVDDTRATSVAIFDCNIPGLEPGYLLKASGIYGKEYQGEMSLALGKFGKAWIDKGTEPLDPLELEILAASKTKMGEKHSGTLATTTKAVTRVSRPAATTAVTPATTAPALPSNVLDKDTYLRGVSEIAACITNLYEALVETKIAILDQLKAILPALAEDPGAPDEE